MMARDYLALTATSMSSERSFSAGYLDKVCYRTQCRHVSAFDPGRDVDLDLRHNQIQNQEDGEENIQPMNTE